MVTFPLIVGRHTRRSRPFSPSPCSPNPLFFNSFPLISFADPHHLNPVASYLYKNHRGEEGVPPALSASTVKSVTPVFATLPEKPLLSPVIATDSKTPSRKFFARHRFETPRSLLPFGTINRQSAGCCIIPRRGRLGIEGFYEMAPQWGS